MNKVKYLHSKKTSKGRRSFKKRNKPIKHKNSSYEILPIHSSMKRKKDTMGYSDTYLSFNPMSEFMMSNLGKDWNDLYSEIIKKTKPKYRFSLERWLKYVLHKPMFYINEVPYGKKYHCIPLYNVFYIDKTNTLQYFETKEELLIHAKNKLRENKLKRLLYESIFNTNNVFNNNELILTSQ